MQMSKTVGNFEETFEYAILSIFENIFSEALFKFQSQSVESNAFLEMWSRLFSSACLGVALEL